MHILKCFWATGLSFCIWKYAWYLQIKDGEIFASINQKDGMVSFQEDPEQYNTCDMTQRLNTEIHQYVPACS